jgi:hypothetical protein
MIATKSSEKGISASVKELSVRRYRLGTKEENESELRQEVGNNERANPAQEERS